MTDMAWLTAAVMDPDSGGILHPEPRLGLESEVRSPTRDWESVNGAKSVLLARLSRESEEFRASHDTNPRNTA